MLETAVEMSDKNTRVTSLELRVNARVIFLQDSESVPECLEEITGIDCAGTVSQSS